MEVERHLHDSDGEARAPDQYFDPVSVAGLVVSIASLALAVYQELRKHTNEPAQEVITRRVRIESRDTPGSAALPPGQHDRIVTVVVEETLRHTSDGG